MKTLNEFVWATGLASIGFSNIILGLGCGVAFVCLKLIFTVE